ncbi:SIR2 family NAD-dependent protein deacylase [Mycolicibacter hiberniae]|uniref:NAD-dependent protein deacylase n=1 Tax=Mycolicibacter hiberniae TaxID=29314 RepID=A0A7I7WYL0_9MYCO|nr:NAD-dependent deacylase [Mycolicibacter hiberniae]MCV7086655.1 NAD-dependent deacylase [Mycolicibacter hiberniae]ORV67003.1 NAD-dependent deacylase [Mycolicibacter hiberniae]BBZ22240.1 NAD-dependent protein deacylase [Mycolicibacter hiberniae]
MRVVVFSGAGISAESGIPTFRDDENGLWSQYDPYEVSSIDGWNRHPELVWGWYVWRCQLARRYEPNLGHTAIADWEQHAEVQIITQNVDNLHERGGSSTVHHLHGRMFTFRCSDCHQPHDTQLPELAEPVLEIMPPQCECGGLIRPDVVWFGEDLPDGPWNAAVEAVDNCDVMVVVGTSGVVYPAASLPERALDLGKTVVQVNPEPTPLSERATVHLLTTASAALPGMAQRLPFLLR